MRAYHHVVSTRNGGSSRPQSAGNRRNHAHQPTRPSSSNYTSQHVTNLLVTARRRAYGGSGQGGAPSSYAHHGSKSKNSSSARQSYGSSGRGSSSSGRQQYTSRYGGYLHQRPQSAQGGAYRLARSRKQEQKAPDYQTALLKQKQSSHQQQHMRVAGSGTSKNNFQTTNYWGGAQQQKNEVAHHHPLLQPKKSSKQPYDGLHTSHTNGTDRWKQRGSLGATGKTTTTTQSSKHSSRGTIGDSTKKSKSSTSPLLKASKDSVSRTLSVSSQNNRSNPNAPLITLSSSRSKDDKTKVYTKQDTSKAHHVSLSTGNGNGTSTGTSTSGGNGSSATSKSGQAQSSAKSSATVASAIADEAEIAAEALVGGEEGSSGATGSASGASGSTAVGKKPNDFAKMREANRLLAERNLKLREELELLRHQQQKKTEKGGAGDSTESEPIIANDPNEGGLDVDDSGTTTATKLHSKDQGGTNKSGGGTTKTNGVGATSNDKKKSGGGNGNGNGSGGKRGSKGSSSGGTTVGGADWWDKNYAMQKNTSSKSTKSQRPQSAGRVKSDLGVKSGTGGGTNAATYMNTLRPQRRPGSAGRTRVGDSSSSSKGGAAKKQRPTTAPGRRREDQPVAHGMSDQMVDAASEEVRLRALMNDVNWDGRGRSDMYHFGKVLGTGSFGVVRLVHHKLSGTKTAVKTYDKRKIKDAAQLKRVQQEIRLMARANHPNIVRLFETLESQHRVHLVMEYVAGGNLCQYVKLKKKLTESEAKLIFQQLSHASAYLHSINVAHRDIKLENVLFGSDKIAKLTDFGFSVYTKDHRLKVFCGTPSYMAPEIVMRREYYGFPVDVWSLGVLLYAMLCGCFPFTANSYPNLYKKIAVGQFSMPKSLSQNVRDVLRRMLCVNPPKRITMNQVRRHQWTVSGEIYVPLKANESPLLVSDNPSEDLQNNEVVSHMQALGFRRGSVVESVLGRKKNHITTCFYLLCEKIGLPKKNSGTGGNSGAGSNSSSSNSNNMNLAASAPAANNKDMRSGDNSGRFHADVGMHGGAKAGAMAGKAGAHEGAIASSTAKKSNRPSTAGSSRGSSSGPNSNSARTSGFSRPGSAGRTRSGR